MSSQAGYCRPSTVTATAAHCVTASPAQYRRKYRLRNSAAYHQHSPHPLRQPSIPSRKMETHAR